MGFICAELECWCPFTIEDYKGLGLNGGHSMPPFPPDWRNLPLFHLTPLLQSLPNKQLQIESRFWALSLIVFLNPRATWEALSQFTMLFFSGGSVRLSWLLSSAEAHLENKHTPLHLYRMFLLTSFLAQGCTHGKVERITMALDWEVPEKVWWCVIKYW